MRAPYVQSWDAAGAGQNADDRNFLSWALSLVMDLLFPGKKPKDVIEEGRQDDIDPNKKKKDDNVKASKVSRDSGMRCVFAHCVTCQYVA